MKKIYVKIKYAKEILFENIQDLSAGDVYE